MSSSDKIVSLEHIFKTYYAGGNPVPVLKDVNLSVGRGEFLGILGTSGSGKSTMLNILGMLDVPTSGIYQLEEVQVDLLTDSELATIRNRKIGFIFQGFNLFPHLTIEQNVEIPMLYGRVDRKVRRQRAHELIERVGLGHRFGHRPNQLSGGECQRVAIARALSNHPSFLLADEPTGNLDSRTSQDVLSLLKVTGQKFNQTIVMITHNEEIAQMADRIIHIEDGKVIGGKADVEGAE